MSYVTLVFCFCVCCERDDVAGWSKQAKKEEGYRSDRSHHASIKQPNVWPVCARNCVVSEASIWHRANVGFCCILCCHTKLLLKPYIRSIMYCTPRTMQYIRSRNWQFLALRHGILCAMILHTLLSIIAYYTASIMLYMLLAKVAYGQYHLYMLFANTMYGQHHIVHACRQHSVRTTSHCILRLSEVWNAAVARASDTVPTGMSCVTTPLLYVRSTLYHIILRWNIVVGAKNFF